MSVFIEDYCKGDDSDFAKRLNELWKEVVLIGSDELDFYDDGEMLIARIYIAHSITCGDVVVIQRVFSDWFWSFTASFRGAGFELCVRLKG